MSYKLFGIEIERKTDILAFAAFVISLAGLLTQLVNLIKGPDVVMEAPKQVLFNSHKYPDGKQYIRIAAKQIYLNKGSPGYADISKSEEVYFFIKNKKVQLNAQEYIESSFENGKLIPLKKSDADPIQIKSGGVEVHETYYAPWPSNDAEVDSNYIEFSEFVSYLKNQDELNLIFTAITFSGTKNIVECRVITREFIHHLESKKWSAPVCR